MRQLWSIYSSRSMWRIWRSNELQQLYGEGGKLCKIKNGENKTGNIIL